MYVIHLQPGVNLLSLEAAEALDRVREGADRLRNNTNSFLSGELLSLMPVRINVSGESEENSLRIKCVQSHHSEIADGTIIVHIVPFLSAHFSLNISELISTLFSVFYYLRTSFL